MWYSCIHHWRNLIVILGVWSIVPGCASTPTSYQTSREEGIQFARPNPGTRVVVRGNHLSAVNHALGWLNSRQLLVVNRWVEKEAPGVSPRGMTDLQNQALAVAQKVGATLVVFVQVDETSLNHTGNDVISVSRQPGNMIGVEVQGMNVTTGEVAFGAKAWSSEPLAASERVVQDLTILALGKAWEEPSVSRSRQKEEPSEIPTEKIRAEEIPTEEVRAEEIQTAESASMMTPVPMASSDPSPVDQSVPGEPMATSQEQVTVFTEPRLEETSPAPVVTQPEADERSMTSEDPSFGLQIASGALSLLYTPLKIVYAGLGGFIGGFVYALTGGNEQVAQSVWDASLGGTYLLTPDHLQGNEPIRFKGESTN
jgi:hypothetical protein